MKINMSIAFYDHTIEGDEDDQYKTLEFTFVAPKEHEDNFRKFVKAQEDFEESGISIVED